MNTYRKSVFLAYLVITFLVSCKKDMVQTQVGVPIIVTSLVTSISTSSAVTGGNISSDGGASVTSRGVAYSTVQNPSAANIKTNNGTGTGDFISILTTLTSSTTYYVRSYATNSLGTSYGNEMNFTTDSPPGLRCPGTPSVTDIDGNMYNTLQIGNQCWTQSNLKVSKYRNGDNIPTGLSNSAWETTTSGAYAIYNTDSVNDGLYGKLYNHYTVTDSRGLCPTGWHVPSDTEWTTLENNLGGSSVAGGALKSTAMQPTPWGWSAPNGGGTNSSGFTALPGGLRDYLGFYSNMNENGTGWWWSSKVSSGSRAWCRILYPNGGRIIRNSDYKSNGFSVRCLKD